MLRNVKSCHFTFILSAQNPSVCRLSGEAFWHISALLYFWATKNGNWLLWAFFFFFSLEGFSDPKQEHGGGRSELFPKQNLRPYRNKCPDSAGIPGFMEKKNPLLALRAIINHSSCEMKLNNWKKQKRNLNLSESYLHFAFLLFPCLCKKIRTVIPACTTFPTHYPQVFILLLTKSTSHQ